MTWLRDPTVWGWVFYASEWVIRLAMLAVVPFRRAPAAANSWLVLIFFLPWPGLLLYLLIGRTTLPRWRMDLVDRLPEALGGVFQRLRAHPNISHPDVGPELEPAVRLARNLGRMPILGGNAVELLADYDGIINRLIADIDAARDHVHLLYYIFADDATGNRILDALARALRRGVKCRVLIDAVGSRVPLRTLWWKLKAAGVAVRETLPIHFFSWRRIRLDLRNHRKIAVLDGRVGYTGSQNLVNATFKEGIVYEELMARVTGPVVLELQAVFASDWFVETGEALDTLAVFPDPEITGDVPAQALPSGPGFPTQNTQRLVVALIHAARERVVLTTPYFIPDESLLQALQTAVLRGVEVILMMARQADQVLVCLAQRSYYTQLLEAGVKIVLYERRFLHAKHISIDDSVCLIGSSNLDIRSFLLNAEISLLFYDRRVTGLLRKEQERCFADAEFLSLEKWNRRPLMTKLAQRWARLMSPLL